ncbi:MAG: alpha-D-ribose 1-methylphosphonate 5-triphosphate diphosphatase [Acetobacteraceae bacterium]|nr:alpha-D-ribose 1-methylphosphonate 5-triphosphate diphosphatase [Acetobacteraceae bacterium]
MSDFVLTNAKLVLRDEVLTGTVHVRDGRIADVASRGTGVAGAIDCGGDYIIPGIVDVHTDNLERQVLPRVSARWPSRSAMVAHDAQCAAAGVTTVLDALCIGDLGFDGERIRTFKDAVIDLNVLVKTGLLKAEHYLHLRCELPAEDTLELFFPVADDPLVRMISLMDHSPGVGQYANLDAYRAMRTRDGVPASVIEARIEKLSAQRVRMRGPNRAALLAKALTLDVTLASHDDRTIEEINENFADGIRISEFPVTVEAAIAARALGMTTIAGAPNIVRGGSHSGNVKVTDLIRAGGVDALASDYVPAALAEAAFLAAEQTEMSLPDAVAMVTDTPAQMARLADRGRIEAGLRADLVRLRLHGSLPILREVWRAGLRVA